jgi:dolichol-phosphate mannosyltransferase
VETTLISIIVPVYNEKQNIEPTAREILEVFGTLSSELEILFVDDNSPDGTADEVVRVSRFIPQAKLVQHGKKEGIGAAHHAGYFASRGKYIMCIDADLSQSPSELLKMKEKLDKGYDQVIGSRYMAGGEQIGKPRLRDWGSRGMNLICRLFLGIPLTDCTHTFKAFRRSVFENISSKLDQKGHPNFQVQFSFWTEKKGYESAEIPIKFVERVAGRGETKISVKRELPQFIILVIRLMFYRFFSRQINSKKHNLQKSQEPSGK